MGEYKAVRKSSTMSLATSGGIGGGAGGGMSMATMAHGGPSALSTHQQASNAGGTSGPPPGTSAPPPNMASMAADLIDKNQSLNWKSIKNLAKMPIVSCDIYGDSGEVAYFPPVSNMDEEDEVTEENKGGIKVKGIGKVSATGSSLVFHKDSDAAHKTLRKLIAKGKGYTSVFANSLSDKKSKDSTDTVTLSSPHLLVGERQVKYLSESTASRYTIGKDSSHAIDMQDSCDSVTISNGNLDGSTSAQNDKYDRVTVNLKIHSKKKSVSILPEEAVKVILNKAKMNVSKVCPSLEEPSDADEEAFVEYPMALALPAWACNHCTIEGLNDACDNTAVFYNRSMAALSGAFVPKFGTQGGKKGLIPAPIYTKIMERVSAHRKKIQEAQQRKESLPNTNYLPIVVMAGMTEDGVELTAVQLKNPNASFGIGNVHCPFGEMRVVSSVAYQSTKSVALVNKALVELSDNVDEICPELEDDGGVVAMVTYGTIAKQLQLKDALNKALNGIKGDEVWNTRMEFLSTQEDAVAVGTSVLAGVSHSRLLPEATEDGKGSRPSVVVKNVAPCAVGISYSFDSGKSFSEPKVIFEYDRRVPAGPYKIDFSAAECVALKKDPTLLNDSEKLYEEAEKWNKSKHNSLREEAALSLKVIIKQQFERNGKWRELGFDATPLIIKSDEDEDEAAEPQAIEKSTIEVSLDSIGFLSFQLESDGQTIAQADKAAKSSKFWKWVRIIGAIAFFGGFMAKSYLDERNREICANKVLAYYKRASPNSINDGDKHHAHYTCYKYRGKHEKLYKKLEKKYGFEMKEVDEWNDGLDDPQPPVEEDEEQEENLDEEKEEL